MMRRSVVLCLWAFTVVVPRALAQPATAPVATQPAAAGELITLNLPETVEIRTLADYVSKRLDLNIIYGEDVGAQRVVVRAPAKLPRESLLGLLQSAVQMKGLALVDGEAPGLKKIVAVTSLGPSARLAEGGKA